MLQLLKNGLAGAVVVGGMLLATSAQAVVVWDETADGDISGDRLNPSSKALVVGSNTLTATSVGPNATADREYIHFSMPPNSKLKHIYLLSYQNEGSDETAFIGVQSGTTFTEPATSANPNNILGHAHFGPTLVGFDILPDIGQGFNSIGFTPPLPGGNYTFWMQQTGTDATTYSFDFQVVPEPGTLAILGMGAMMLVASVRRRVPR